MKKLLFLFLLIPFVVSAQWKAAGNVMQVTADGYKYRISLGSVSPGYFYTYTEAQVDSAIAAQSSGGVSSFNTRTGLVTLQSADVTTALGYTPLSGATNGLTNTSGVITFGGALNQNTDLSVQGYDFQLYGAYLTADFLDPSDELILNVNGASNPTWYSQMGIGGDGGTYWEFFNGTSVNSIFLLNSGMIVSDGIGGVGLKNSGNYHAGMLATPYALVDYSLVDSLLLRPSGVTAGSYTNATIAVNLQGQITSATSNAGATIVGSVEVPGVSTTSTILTFTNSTGTYHTYRIGANIAGHTYSSGNIYISVAYTNEIGKSYTYNFPSLSSLTDSFWSPIQISVGTGDTITVTLTISGTALVDCAAVIEQVY